MITILYIYMDLLAITGLATRAIGYHNRYQSTSLHNDIRLYIRP